MVVLPERNLESTEHQMQKPLRIFDGILKAREGNKTVLSSCLVVENVLFHVVGIMATISVRWFETLGGYSHSTEAVLGRRRKTHLY